MLGTETASTQESPSLLTILDISKMLRLNVMETRRFVKRHKADLKPFKVGREVRCHAANFRTLLDKLQQAAN